MATAPPHVTVCICTYKRPALLKRALDALCEQATGGLFTFSITVVDNDATESAREATESATGRGVRIDYCVEPEQNIARARNRGIASSGGDFITFLDDDEYPIRAWLLTLFQACQTYGADGALGPVKPYFD